MIEVSAALRGGFFARSLLRPDRIGVDYQPGSSMESIPRQWTKGNVPAVLQIGYGAAGGALAAALRGAGWSVSDLENVPERIDLLILAVPDGRIAEAAVETAGKVRAAGPMTGTGGPFPPTAVHLSGRLGLAVLDPLAEAGFARLALHPMQTFPPGAGPERFHGVYAGVTSDPDARAAAGELATALGVSPVEVPDEARGQYHLACVLASNFLPLLLAMGAARLEGVAGDPGEAEKMLLPLVRGMVESLAEHGSAGAMTGPVARDDLETVAAHLRAGGLTEHDRALYLDLTAGLVEMAHRAGRLDDDQTRHWREWLLEAK